MARRIQMKLDATPEPIIAPDGTNLGTFLPGLGYWVTPDNEAVVAKVLGDGRAYEVDADNAPLNMIRIGAMEGKITGSMSVEEVVKAVGPGTKRRSG